MPTEPSPATRRTRVGRDGATEVVWLEGGVLVRWREHGFLIDAPPGVTHRLGADLPSVRAVVLTGGRWQAVGGLIELLCRLGRYRNGLAMDLRVPLGEERGVALAETWVRTWGSPYPLALDMVRPGTAEVLGPMHVAMHPMRAGEPDGAWQTITPRLQVAVRITSPDASVAWVPGAAPADAVRKVCDGVDLAVVEAGVEPWPSHEGRWRMTPTEAAERASGADRLWLVGDDGHPLHHQLPEA